MNSPQMIAPPVLVQPDDRQWYLVVQTPDTYIPANEPLRIWVRLINGMECEMHSRYDPQFGWELPLGLRMHILQIVAWQKITPPTCANTTIGHKDSGYGINTVVEQRYKTMNRQVTQIQAQLCQLVLPKTFSIQFSISEETRIQTYIQTGQLIEAGTHTIDVPLTEIPQDDPQTREAIAWIGPQYLNQTIDIGYVNQIPTAEMLCNYIHQAAVWIKERKTKELQQLYLWIINGLNGENDSLFNKLYQINLVKSLTRFYSHPILQDAILKEERSLLAKYYQDRHEWIQNCGSKYLRYLHRHQYDIEELYVTERLHQEMPGFQIFYQQGEWIRKLTPEPDEIEIAEIFPNSTIVTRPSENNSDFHETAIAIYGFLGLYPIIGLVDNLREHVQHPNHYKFRSLASAATMPQFDLTEEAESDVPESLPSTSSPSHLTTSNESESDNVPEPVQTHQVPKLEKTEILAPKKTLLEENEEELEDTRVQIESTTKSKIASSSSSTFLNAFMRNIHNKRLNQDKLSTD